jgi:hypothetical protein
MFLNAYNLRKSVSFWAIILLVIANAWYGKNLKRWDKNEIINNDVTQYYAYFPATFIYNDWHFNFVEKLPSDFEGRIWLQNTPEGNPVLKMTMGLSILWLPFESTAHTYAKHSHYQANGYSKPYSIAIFISALFYLLLGLIFLRKILLKYFNEITTTITLLLIVLATNLMHYVISEPGMSHIYNFFLITTFIYLCIKWHDNPTWSYSILLGIVAGFIVLIRPVNIITGCIFLFWNVNSFDSFLQKMKLIFIKKWMILIAVFAAIIIIIPQIAYWKIATDHWIFYSYGEQGFFFLHPHIIDGLFSYRKGWLIYTPVMFFAFVGFFFIHKFTKKITLALLITIWGAVYIVYSWWTWWYGGSFGSRPMIDFYGIMALPLAALIQSALRSRIWVKSSLLLILSFLLYLNQFQMEQYRTSLLHWDSMTKEAYWNIMLTKHWPDGYDKMIKPPDYDKALKGEDEY